MGGNIVRLSNLVAGSVLVLGLSGPRRRLLLALCAVPLLYWQWQGAVRDVSRAIADPTAQRSFYTPLLSTLHRQTGGAPVRIEIPPTEDRWEAYYVAPKFLLARGWERQLESDEIHFFRDLTPASYHSWLRSQGVSYVALPKATFDYLSLREAALVAGGLPYLKPIWHDANWRLFAVRGAVGLIQAPARLDEVGAEQFQLQAPRAGDYLLRIHFNRYWTVSGGAACLRGRGPWTMVEAQHPGSFHVGTDLTAGALFDQDRVCSEAAG
jgi:hypothetical protein